MKTTIICALVLLFAIGCCPLKKHMPPGFGEGVMIDYPPIPGGRPQGPLATPGETRGEKRTPSGSGFVPDAAAVVLPPELVPVVFEWTSNVPGHPWHYAFYGYIENAITEPFGVTDNWAITNSIPWPDWAEGIYGYVKTRDEFGNWSLPSLIAKFGGWPCDAIRLNCIPAIDAQIFVLQSPDMKHWFGYFTRLPETNYIASGAAVFYRASTINWPTNAAGLPTTNGLTPITLTVEKLQLKEHKVGG